TPRMKITRVNLYRHPVNRFWRLSKANIEVKRIHSFFGVQPLLLFCFFGFYTGPRVFLFFTLFFSCL
ncbi:MAG: hypothetical protein WCH01_19375, partial [Methylococcaceae bacterium]